MLNLFARHGLFDLQVEAEGDIDIDFHHTVEVSASFLLSIETALADKAGIRYGQRRAHG
jgi:imidazoleglycerol-phosphate dehydratase